MKKKYRKVQKVGAHALATVRKFFPSVSNVRDADEKLLIEVTQQDEKNSRKGDHGECAMAVACKRKLKVTGVIMSRSTAYLIKGNTATRFKVPVTVSREITSFDRGAGFDIGTYELAKPSPGNRLDAQMAKSYTKPLGNHVPVFRHVTSNIRAVIGGKHAKEDVV